VHGYVLLTPPQHTQAIRHGLSEKLTTSRIFAPHLSLPLFFTHITTMASATASTLETPSISIPQTSASASTNFQPIKIGTRRSTLAQIQARLVEKTLKDAYPDRKYAIHAILAQGDKDKVTPLQQLSMGENAKSLWTGELEEMLLKGELDMIVHCLKGE